MENYKPFSCLGIPNTSFSENQLSHEVLTARFYPGMAMYIKNSVAKVNSSLNFFVTPVCPGKKGFIALYCSYN
jgi:hypothetical protein